MRRMFMFSRRVPVTWMILVQLVAEVRGDSLGPVGTAWRLGQVGSDRPPAQAASQPAQVVEVRRRVRIRGVHRTHDAVRERRQGFVPAENRRAQRFTVTLARVSAYRTPVAPARRRARPQLAGQIGDGRGGQVPVLAPARCRWPPPGRLGRARDERGGEPRSPAAAARPPWSAGRRAFARSTEQGPQGRSWPAPRARLVQRGSRPSRGSRPRAAQRALAMCTEERYARGQRADDEVPADLADPGHAVRPGRKVVPGGVERVQLGRASHRGRCRGCAARSQVLAVQRVKGGEGPLA